MVSEVIDSLHEGGVDENTAPLYALVDALQIPLHLVQGSIKGYEARKYTIGGFWNGNSDWVVESDVLNIGTYSFFLKMKGNLWAYLITAPQGMWMILFDGDSAKIRVGAIAEFKTREIRKSLDKIKDHARGSFAWDPEGQTWGAFDVLAMLT